VVENLRPGGTMLCVVSDIQTKFLIVKHGFYLVAVAFSSSW